MPSAALSLFVASLYVAVGGAVGSVARYLLGLAIFRVTSPDGFPWALLSINTLGSLAMGLLFGWLGMQDGGNETQRLLIGVGMLGGFTTFSAFSLEILMMIHRGTFWLAMVFVVASVLAGFAALVIGLTIMKGTA